MADLKATNSPVSAGLQADDWCVGVFARGDMQLPAHCLERCLNGDPGLAGLVGCSMLKQLMQRSRAEGCGGPIEAPPVCPRGLAARLALSDGVATPDVLVLFPPQYETANLQPAVELIRNLSGEAWRLQQENNGLAEEVLRNYEQINLIFDVSAQISILQDADEVRRMLLLKLRYLFDADSVFYFSPDLKMVREVTRTGRILRGWVNEKDGVVRCDATSDDPDATITLPRELPLAVESLRKARRVLVSSEDGSHQQTGHGTSLWGPVTGDGDELAIIGIVRRRKEFIAGDMLVLDSALTFGSHILNNLRLVEQVKRTSFEAVRALVNAIDQKDNYTCGHSERVGFLARMIGEHMRLPPEVQQQLEWSGLLHDVGKIGIPEKVLNKPGALTSEEFAVIKGHPRRSYEVLKPVASLEGILEGVLRHHENPDGSGYPDNLRGDQIALTARIIHVVDVFDALTSTRSYRKAYDADRAIAIIREDAGKKLDAHIVEQFLKAWELLPQTHPQQYQEWFASIDPRAATSPGSTTNAAAAAEDSAARGEEAAAEAQPEGTAESGSESAHSPRGTPS